MAEPTVVIVDDEPLARAKLQRFLIDDARTRIVGEAGDGVEAVNLIETSRPDIVLLDIQMPEMDGFQVIEALDMDPLPHIIFVTAHDRHALRAFEVRALDYLLKPVDRQRFTSALDRALEEAGQAGSTVAVDARAVLSELPAERRLLERFLVRGQGRMLLLAVERIDWIGAAGNYAELHSEGSTHLVRGTLHELESRLPDRFVRVHRSTIVNLDRVKELHDWSHGDLLIELVDGTELRLSRRYRERIEGIFGL
jgi:two-component system LytT family response regulator